MRLLVYVVPIGLAIYALIDFARSTPGERGGLHPAAWAAVIVLLPVVGPISWIAISRYLRSEQGGGSAGRPVGPTRPGPRMPRRRGPVAPDDDPEFLWRLERERRRQRGQAGRPEGAAGGRPSPDDQPDLDDAPDGDHGTRGARGGHDPEVRRDAEDGDGPRG
jgi:hypothetical protein